MRILPDARPVLVSTRFSYSDEAAIKDAARRHKVTRAMWVQLAALHELKREAEQQKVTA